MAVCLERHRPNDIVQLSDADGFAKLQFELIIGTIEECYNVGSNNHKLLRPSSGGSRHRYDPVKAVERNRHRLEEWLKDPAFKVMCRHFGMRDTDLAHTLNLVMGGQTQLVEKYINKLNHKGRKQ